MHRLAQHPALVCFFKQQRQQFKLGATMTSRQGVIQLFGSDSEGRLSSFILLQPRLFTLANAAKGAAESTSLSVLELPVERKP